jgi:hypothetical protein
MGIKEDILTRQKNKLFGDIIVIILMGVCMLTIILILLFIIELVFKVPSGHSKMLIDSSHYRINK